MDSIFESLNRDVICKILLFTSYTDIKSFQQTSNVSCNFIEQSNFWALRYHRRKLNNNNYIKKIFINKEYDMIINLLNKKIITIDYNLLNWIVRNSHIFIVTEILNMIDLKEFDLDNPERQGFSTPKSINLVDSIIKRPSNDITILMSYLLEGNVNLHDERIRAYLKYFSSDIKIKIITKNVNQTPENKPQLNANFVLSAVIYNCNDEEANEIITFLITKKYRPINDLWKAVFLRPVISKKHFSELLYETEYEEFVNFLFDKNNCKVFGILSDYDELKDILLLKILINLNNVINNDLNKYKPIIYSLIDGAIFENIHIEYLIALCDKNNLYNFLQPIINLYKLGLTLINMKSLPESFKTDLKDKIKHRY